MDPGFGVGFQSFLVYGFHSDLCGILVVDAGEYKSYKILMRLN
jgi:hypothetical protein